MLTDCLVFWWIFRHFEVFPDTAQECLGTLDLLDPPILLHQGPPKLLPLPFKLCGKWVLYLPRWTNFHNFRHLHLVVIFRVDVVLVLDSLGGQGVVVNLLLVDQVDPSLGLLLSESLVEDLFSTKVLIELFPIQVFELLF